MYHLLKGITSGITLEKPMSFEDIEKYLGSLNFESLFICARPRGSVRVGKIEKRLNLSRETIVKTLQEAGYNVPTKGSFYLTEDQITVISKYYVKSIQKHFKRLRKAQKGLGKSDLRDNVAFFSSFINSDELITPENLFKFGLNESLIQEFFYNLINSSPSETGLDQFFYAILSKIRIRIAQVYKDFRTRIFSIIITNHYHIFPSEEDNRKAALNNKSFSLWISLIKRKAIINFNFIKAFFNEK